MEIETLFGLPAHPLIVHAAVVLLPLAAVTLVVAAVIPRARRIAAPIALGLALVSTVAVVLAEGSGEELEHQVKETAAVEAHTETAENVLPWAIGTTLVAAVAVVADPLRRRWNAPSARVVTVVLACTAVIVGVGATATVIDVGHSGAKATWGDLQNGSADGT
jgi:hypothetical protein